MFDQDKNIKEATRVISELYPADAKNERTCERWFAKWREGVRSLQDLPRTGRPQILYRQSLKAVERWFGCDKPGIGNRFWILPANNNLRISWHRKGVKAREVDSFQTFKPKTTRSKEWSYISQCSSWPRKRIFLTQFLLEMKSGSRAIIPIDGHNG